MFTIDMDGDGVNDSEDDGQLPFGVAYEAATQDTSLLGTRLRSAIESSGDFVYNCGHCKNFFASLNRKSHQDVDAILDELMLHGELPIAIRETVGGIKEQRAWLRAIVERVMSES